MAVAFAHMDRLMALPDAARMLGVSEASLRDLIQKGIVKVSFLPGGEIGVSEDVAKVSQLIVLNARLQDIRREQFAHLDASWITIAEAEAKYKVPNRTIRKWLSHSYIKTDASTYPSKVNEGDLAYCMAIYSERQDKGIHFGAPLLDDNNRPYQLKHPSLSEYRKRKKE